MIRQLNKLAALGAATGMAMLVVTWMVLSTDSGNVSAAARSGGAAIDPAVVAPAEQLSKAFAAVAAKVRPAVVSVYAEKHVTVGRPGFPFPFGGHFFHQFFGGQGPDLPPPHEFHGEERGTGSGMILDQQGHILTNYHVVRDVDELKVQLADQRKFAATVVGSDPQTDVAVIKIKGKVPPDLTTVVLGDSEALQVGNLVEAIGAPFGLVQTVTTGIISATGRSDVGIADYEDFLQTDAAINPGNSGGPLVNMRGEVVGMNSAIATSVGQFAGVGFAIPSSMIKAMLPTLIKSQKIVRGQLGVLIQDLTTDLARQFGLAEVKGSLVSQVNRGSPAEKAGIKAGDVIVRFAGQEVTNTRELRNRVASTPPNTKVTIGIVRDGKPQSLTATIGTQTAESLPAAPSQEGANPLAKLGLTVQTLTPRLAKQLGAEVDQGVLIANVAPGSPGSMAGLQREDIIVEADRRRVASVAELGQVLAKAKNKNQVLLRVTRRGGSLFVVIQP